MDFTTLQNVSPVYPMYIKQYKDTLLDPNSDVQTKMNSVVQSLNQLSQNENDLVNNWNKVMQWAMNDGLDAAVSTQMTALENSGYFNSLLTSLFNSELGTETLATSSQDIKGAINEVKGIADSNTSALAKMSTDITSGALDRVGASSKFVTNMNSYIALVNTMYPSDNGTRFYIVPKAKVTTGVGGVIKLFGDDYQNGADYRDMGWYFSADQQNDKGYFGNGVFWFNQKIFPGGQYDGKNPDIGFSFQDGETVAGRIVRLGAQKPIWVFGATLPTLHGINPNTLVEFQGDVGFKNNVKLNFRNHTNDKDANIRMNTDDSLYIQTWTGVKFFDNGATEVLDVNTNGVQPKIKLVQNYLAITNNSATPDVSAGNVFVINNSVATSITDLLNATQGQQVTLIINDANTTLINGTNIKLKGGTNFRPTNLLSNITLMRLGSSWVEMARTEL